MSSSVLWRRVALRRIQAFRRTSSWLWRQQDPLNRSYPTTTLHGVTTQKTSTRRISLWCLGLDSPVPTSKLSSKRNFLIFWFTLRPRNLITTTARNFQWYVLETWHVYQTWYILRIKLIILKFIFLLAYQNIKFCSLIYRKRSNDHVKNAL
jgi:hypothetical protein